jgi:hypothetical protein
MRNYRPDDPRRPRRGFSRHEIRQRAHQGGPDELVRERQARVRALRLRDLDAAAAKIKLTPAEVAELEAAISRDKIAGARYNATSLKLIDQ